MKKLKVLICDDSATHRRTIQNQLSGYNLEFVHASNGNEAITYLDIHEGEFDLLTLDDQMPEMDGISTLEQLKSLGIQCPPIVMVASESQKELVLACIQKGANDFILKSHLGEKLIEKVAMALNLNNKELVKKSYFN